MRAAYLLADAVLAFYPSWDTEPIVEIARAARAAAGDCGDPLSDYILGYELARQGSIEEAWQLMAGVERTILSDPARLANPAELVLAAWCAWWRSDLRAACALYARAVDRQRELGLAALVAQGIVALAGYQIDVGAWTRPTSGSPRRSGWARTRAS